MPYYPKPLESWGTLIHQREIELLSLDRAHRCFNRRAFVNVEPVGLEGFGETAQVFDVFIENQHVADAAEVLGFVCILSRPLSHLWPLKWNLLTSMVSHFTLRAMLQNRTDSS